MAELGQLLTGPEPNNFRLLGVEFEFERLTPACLYDVSNLNASNVNDCVKGGESIMYQGLWDTGPFIRGGTAPSGPTAGYGPGWK